MIRILLCLMIMALPCRAAAQDANPWISRLLPHYAQLQFAGNLGFLSAGLGYNLASDRLHISLNNGVVPASIAGETVNMLSLQASWDLGRLELGPRHSLLPFAGLAGLVETTGHAFLSLPDHFPKGYYGPSALHGTCFLGLKWRHQTGKRAGERLELYGSLGALDSHIYYVLKNNGLHAGQLLSGALGISYHFGRRP